MTKNNKLNNQEELFARDCKLINLKYEYDGYIGTEKWAIVTELTEEELWDKYPDIIGRYIPFVLLSVSQGSVIDESHRNNDKYVKRAARTLDIYGYEDDIFEQFHKTMCVQFLDPFEKAEEEMQEQKKELRRWLEIRKVRETLSMMPPVQRQRLLKYVVEGKSYRQIAGEEGTYHSSVSKSIEAAKKNFKKIYENL